MARKKTTRRKSAPAASRRGRPATGQTPMRNIRATDDQWNAYKAAAERAGLTLSSWIRQTLDEAAAK